MRCDEVAAVLPGLVDGVHERNLAVERHVEECLRCQAELARYRRLLRTLRQLRHRYLEPAPGLLSQTLCALEAEGERRAIGAALSGRRLAYAGAIGGTAVATAATAALLILRHRRRGGLPLAS